MIIIIKESWRSINCSWKSLLWSHRKKH